MPSQFAKEHGRFMVVGFEIKPFNAFAVCQRAWKIYGGGI
jgi:hypothetical protein